MKGDTVRGTWANKWCGSGHGCISLKSLPRLGRPTDFRCTLCASDSIQQDRELEVGQWNWDDKISRQEKYSGPYLTVSY